jgi:hypothetical protein
VDAEEEIVIAAQHSSKKCEHGTPPSFRELARYTLGVIHLDPYSEPRWNAAIGAQRIITAAEDARVTPWFPGASAPNRLLTDQRRAPAGHVANVLLNSPGDKRGKLVAGAWTAATTYFGLGWITSLFYVGFNVEQLARLQRVGAPTHPLRHPTLIPPERENYEDAPGVLQEDAPHASFVTLVSRDLAVIGRFRERARDMGALVEGR